MALIVFYEKPGCLNGEKQKAILRQAGNVLQEVDILTHPWTREALLPFVAGKTPAAMMNATAPAIKNGAINPERLSFEQALALMLDQPILIKRPLIVVDGLALQGFSDQRLQPYLGNWDGREDVVTCPNLQTLSCDEQR
ncbi:MAG: hypothetical protein JZU50_02435 [Desulfobulbaceae bacterium]|nr:hypothetical protein [Desulfobulbaceae bacterium]